MPLDASSPEPSGPHVPTLRERSAGILLHPTSLPGPFGCGELGPASDRFVDWLGDAGLRWWQMLPVGPLGFGNSPYSAGSAFAGNPLLIGLESLAEQGWWSGEPSPPPALPIGRVDYARTSLFREQALAEAFESWNRRGRERPEGWIDFAEFCGSQAGWLEDYALFSALKKAHGSRPWVEWSSELRDRHPAALDDARRRLAREVELERFLQWVFEAQWRQLRSHCRSRGVGLIGDLPIFVAHDSSDVWAHRELFLLDEEGQPTAVAGVPPDYFSLTGQRWGNPLYRWDVLRASGFRWWVDRLEQMLHRFDAIRLDHFIGFVHHWEIPADCPTAERGTWREGPGASLFEAAAERLGELPIIAEDLGLVTPEVVALRESLGFPGIRLLQFAFGTDPQAPTFLPHNYPRNAVVYTGTHDNDTVEGWFRSPVGGGGRGEADQAGREREYATLYLGACLAPGPTSDSLGPTTMHGAMIRAVLASVSNLAVVPLQDFLGLGSEARMNRPGTLEGNWEWRFEADDLAPELAFRIARLVRIYGRGEPQRGPVLERGGV